MDKVKVWMGVCRHYGPSIFNVAEKYKEFAPEDKIEWVDDWLDADVCIDHLIGTPDRENLVHPLERSFSEDVKARLDMAKMGVVKVAYVMHCAIVPDQFYKDAALESIVCTGFLDAPLLMQEVIYDSEWWEKKWLRVAWGVDPAEFLLPTREEQPEYTIYTWGASQDPEEEYIRTIYEAVKEYGGKMLHSGLDYKFDDGEHYVFVPPARTKQEVAQRYNKCRFANAMRREDGFELANVEAPLANAWPITLDKPCYGYFFSGLSLMVDDDRDMKAQLVEIFQNEWAQVSSEHKRDVLEMFNWRDAVTPFWDRVMEGVENG